MILICMTDSCLLQITHLCVELVLVFSLLVMVHFLPLIVIAPKLSPPYILERHVWSAVPNSLSPHNSGIKLYVYTVHGPEIISSKFRGRCVIIFYNTRSFHINVMLIFYTLLQSEHHTPSLPPSAYDQSSSPGCYHIGSNCPRISGTVPDFKHLSPYWKPLLLVYC